jgi:hypothetical protein
MRLTSLSAIAFSIFALSACGVADTTDESSSTSAIGNEPELGPPPPCVLARGTVVSGDVHDDIGDASVNVDGEACTRVLTIDSTAPRRDELPAGPRKLVERSDRPSLQTHNAMFDALYQLALAEADECAVDQIRDYAFHNGQPVSCGTGGCFETGRKWNYVWTRDTSYAVDLGLGWVDPTRAKNSLEFKLSPRRDDSSALLLVQDTGTGGSYPVSSDRAVWAVGARRALLHLSGSERAAFGDKAARAIWETIDHDRDVVFDAADGLYRGEQSFLDWRTQTYPEWTVPNTVHIAMSKALSTNVAHLALLETGAELAQEKGDNQRATRLEGMAAALRSRIRERFWLPDEGQFATFVATELDPAPTRRFDLLGTSLAILFDVATPEQARAALSHYPLLPKGPPVVFPQQQDVPIYHNRASWPFVTSYFAKAAKKVGHAPAVDHATRSLLRGAALNLSNMENLEAVTGRAWLDDGASSGPVVNSQRQLWSVAGYIGTIHEVIFGIEARPDGVKVAPFVTTGLRHELFPSAESIVLNNARLRGKQITVVVNLPPDTKSTQSSRALPIKSLRINGRSVRDGAVIPDAVLRDRNLVEVDLAPARGPEASTQSIKVLDDVSDYRTLYAPRTPRVMRVAVQDGKLAVGIDLAGERNVTANIYRDGVRVTPPEGLDESTTNWRDETSEGADWPDRSHCYTVETRFVGSGNVSHRANPVCFWGADNERAFSIDASRLDVQGGAGVYEYGRWFHRGWGAPGDTITATFTARRSGPHLIEATYGNGGPIDTGITCAVKRVDVEEVGGAPAGGGWLVMPQRGSWASWGSSSFVHADLIAGRTYRLRVSHDARSANMSELAHFGVYTAGIGGASGAFSGVNIAELKILAR